MNSTVLKCQKINGGKASGKAIVSKEPISFIGGLDPLTGLVIESGHCLEGRNIKDKVLVYPTSKGSTGGSYRIYEMSYKKTAPAAFVQLERDPISALGCIMAGIPAVDGFEIDPLTFIEDGDFIEVDADKGSIVVTKNNMTRRDK